MAESVGEQLKKAREARKLSLEQVFQATRINVRYLKGLEENDRDALPSAVQAKGFLRLYAGYLGLPVQSLLDTWEGRSLTEPAPAPIPETESPPQPVQPPVTADLATPAPAVDEDANEVVPIVMEPSEEESPADEPAADQPQSLPVSQQVFVEIGSALRTRRESLGLTLADVERFTRLRQHYLKALEEGRMTDLPSLVQARGMLSNYAGFLELNVDDVLLRFADALQQRRLESMPQPQKSSGGLRERKAARPAAKPATPGRPSFRFLTPDILIGGVIVIGLIIFTVWGAAQVSALRNQAQAETAPPIADLILSTPSPAGLPAAGTPVPAPATLQPNAEIGNVPAEENAGEVTPTSLPVIGDAPLQVYVVARQRAWMRVTEDGEVKFLGRTIPGNPYTFSGEESIELVTGNAAALQIYYNQQDLGSLGLNGQVVALIFNAEGILTPTPSFSATPTQTQVPTITPQPSPTLATPSITPFIP